MLNKENTLNYPIISNLYKDYFRIGVACEAINERNSNSEIGNPAKEALMASQFNSMTFGNELKPAYNMGFDGEENDNTHVSFVINPKAKVMLDWAKKHKMPVRGHVLVWHSQCSNRIFCKNYTPVFLDAENLDFEKNPMLRFFAKLDPSCFVDRETMLKRLESYIHSVMEYMFKNGYGNTIYAWDVVNEAIELADNTPLGLRNSYWYQTIGDDFIYWSFKFAREAELKYASEYASLYQVDKNDAKALKSICPKLFYNDYNEWMPDKQKAILTILGKETSEHGSILSEELIDGIGMQGHLSDNNNIKEYIDALKIYAKTVSEVHITELDVKQTCTNINANYYQALFYKEYFKALVDAKKEGYNLTCVTLWGLTDDNSWIQGANPLLFNKDLTKKTAFDGMASVITGESIGEPVQITYDISDKIVDFDTTMDTQKYLEEKGFKIRGMGKLTIQKDVVRSGKAALCLSERRGPWSGLNYDISDFLGQTVEISVWIKSAAESITLNADINGPWPVLGTVDTSSGEWVELKATYRVPHNLYSLVLFFTAKDPDMMVSNDIFIDEISVKLIGLKESFEDDSHIASVRGAGHLPFLYVTDKESLDGASHSLCVTRQEKDATMRFNISSYIGKNVHIEAYVKTTDTFVMLGLDGTTPIQIVKTATNSENWTKISADYQIPDNLLSADLYLETDGKADFYVDDIFVSLNSDEQ